MDILDLIGRNEPYMRNGRPPEGVGPGLSHPFRTRGVPARTLKNQRSIRKRRCLAQFKYFPFPSAVRSGQFCPIGKPHV